MGPRNTRSAIGAPDLPALRRRSARSVFGAVALGHTSLFAAFTVAPLVVVEATGSAALSGLPGATSVAGTAAGAALLSGVMARRGRRPGLVAGYCVGAIGGGIGLMAVASTSLLLLEVAMLLIGIGHGANQLARFAAADAQPAHRRAFVLSWVVWAGTLGAIAGPTLLRPFEPAARAAGAPGLGGGYLVALLFYCAAALLCALALRPDPSALAEDEPSPSVSGPRPPGPMHRAGPVRIAILALVSGQVAMVLIMTLTPVHIRGAGHDLGIVGMIMSAHFVGMYGLAPAAGKLGDRYGRIPVILAGLSALVVAALGAALSPASAGALLAVWLWLLGLGWSFAFVAASALLTTGHGVAARTLLQGRVDTLVWSSSAVASLSSGPLVAAAGYRVLCMLGALGVLGPSLLIARPLLRERRAGPGGARTEWKGRSSSAS